MMNNETLLFIRMSMLTSGGRGAPRPNDVHYDVRSLARVRVWHGNCPAQGRYARVKKVMQFTK